LLAHPLTFQLTCFCGLNIKLPHLTQFSSADVAPVEVSCLGYTR